MNKYLTRLSRKISHALRHAPEHYHLTLDPEGWVPLPDLIDALIKQSPKWRNLTAADFDAVQAQSNKKRFEINQGRIRAYYGHSVPDRIQKDPAEPPEFLYHGTALGTATLVLKDGLKSMARQYVHLSSDTDTANIVGVRKAQAPTILRIQAKAAHQSGIAFYHGNETVWLADHIPARFIEAP